MKTLIHSESEKLLDGFKFGYSFRHGPAVDYTQGVGRRGYWLLIEDDRAGDSQTYQLTQDDGLVHTDTGAEI